MSIVHILFIISCKNESTVHKDKKARETCLDCHKDVKGLTGGHDPEKIGCSSCHLGNGKETDKDRSHRGMLKIPGNLSNAQVTCSTAQCHPGELERIKNSLMTTNSGLISIDKYIFGEIIDPDTFLHIKYLGNSASDIHLKNLCARCHLGYEKREYAKTGELSRGGGCIACHLNYPTGKIDINDNLHPSIDLYVGNDKCFGCHSRSARISASYEGWYETLYLPDEIKTNNEKFRIFKDGRVFAKAGEDVHYKAGLSCIDCHGSREIMGDGSIYKHSREAVKIQCSDCHIKEKFKTGGKEHFDLIAALDYGLRKYKYQSNLFILTEKGNIPLVNSYFDKIPYLISKLDQKLHKLSDKPPACLNDVVHLNLDCNMCHTAWAPTCIGCHTEFDAKKKKWIELVDDFGLAPPAMGVEYSGRNYKIKPAIPAMIMTLDKNSFHGQKSHTEFYRLFSPVYAHTTSKSGRSCISCHIESSALGYGSGKLELKTTKGKAYWKFFPDYQNADYDNLPQDSWIGFLSERIKNKKYSARRDFFPLDLKMQTKVLNAGKCIYCHQRDRQFLTDMKKGKYRLMIKNRSGECRI